MTTHISHVPALKGRRSSEPGKVNLKINKAARIAASLAVAASALWLLMHSLISRAVEAYLVSLWLNPLLPGGVVANGEYYMAWMTPQEPLAFHITPECSALVLISPLLILGAFFLSSQRVRWGRGIAGILAMLVVILIVNQLRFALIAWATQTWGIDPGYEITHKFVGSLLGIAGFVAGLIVLITVSGLRRSKKLDKPQVLR